MFEVNEQWLLPADIVILLIFVIHFWIGYKRGFLRTVVSLVLLVLSYFSSWILSGVLARYIQIWPKGWNYLQGSMFEAPAMRFLNEVSWFLVLLIAFRIVSLLIDRMVKDLQNLPVIHQASALLGGALGLLEGTVLILALSLLCNTPVFSNGNMLVEKTLAKEVNGLVTMAFDRFSLPVIDAEAFNQIYEDASKLSEEQKQAVEEWLKERGFEELSSYKDLGL